MKQNLVILTATVLVALAASHATAAIILQDGFDGAAGAAVDPAKWTANAPPAVQLDGSGNVEMAGGGLTALAGLAAQPAPGEFLRLTVDGYERLTLGGNYCRTGFTTDGSGNVEILLRVAPQYGVWYLRMVNGSNGYQYNTYVAKSITSELDWTIDWYTDRVVVYLGEPLEGNIRVDTSTAEPADILATEGLGLAAPPAVNMVPTIYDSESGEVSGVVWESIPEPATMLLLAIGGLVLRRRH